jgi:hypothetical protein
MTTLLGPVTKVCGRTRPDPTNSTHEGAEAAPQGVEFADLDELDA